MDKYIFELLKLHHKLILPDFGAIVYEDQESGELMFNEFLNYNDTKLAEMIEENSNMDLQAAQNAVAKFVRELKYHLDKGNTYTIYQLGEFYKVKDEYFFSGNIKTGKSNIKTEEERTPYTPPVQPKSIPENPAGEKEKAEEGGVQATPDSLGAATTNKAENTPTENLAKNEERVEPESKIDEPTPIRAAIVEEKTIEKKETEKPKEDEEPAQKKKKSIYGWLALATLLAIIVLFFINNKERILTTIGVTESKREVPAIVEDETTKEQQESVLEETPEASDIEETTEELTVDETRSTEEELVESETEHNDIPASEVTAVQSGSYHLVFGAFSEKQNARKAVEKMKKEGFNAQVIGPFTSKNLYYASAESYASENEAQQNLKRVMAHTSSAWIFKY